MREAIQETKAAEIDAAAADEGPARLQRPDLGRGSAARNAAMSFDTCSNNMSLLSRNKSSPKYLIVARRPKLDRRRRSILRLVQLIGRSADLVVPVSSPFRATDPDDQIYLDAAFAAEVDVFVTGNIADFPNTECGKTLILTPREFLTDTRFSTLR